MWPRFQFDSISVPKIPSTPNSKWNSLNVFNYVKWEGLWTIGKLSGKRKIMQIYLIAMFIISKDSKLNLEISSKYKNIQSHFEQQNMFML
jgi:hypothetical protein